ncbi:hypothetical protein BMJ26_19935, partial [Sinorhizobium medicae]
MDLLEDSGSCARVSHAASTRPFTSGCRPIEPDHSLARRRECRSQGARRLPRGPALWAEVGENDGDR